MPVCYLGTDYETAYSCEYEVLEKKICVTVDYDIMDEIESKNGMTTFNSDTKFDNRDILIVDYENKNNYLLKKAYFAGINYFLGAPDGGNKTKFISSAYFSHKDPEKLISLHLVPKIKKILLTSKSILNWIGNSSLMIQKTNDAITYHLSRKKNPQYIEINHNNIIGINIEDEWHSNQNLKDKNISIEFNGTIEIDLIKKIVYTDIVGYLTELVLYMQLYAPDNFIVDEVNVMIDETYYNISVPFLEAVQKEGLVSKSIEVSLAEHLERCYSKIPYRISNNNIRNIPYIILKTARGLEDNFLMFYRFIECYYKAKNNKKNRFVTESITQYCDVKHFESEDEIKRYSQEIISLRNHYIHSGYYLKNSSLKVNFEKINDMKNPLNYTVNNIDAKWIYDRTFILYRIVINIIFRDMLGYDVFSYDKHF